MYLAMVSYDESNSTGIFWFMTEQTGMWFCKFGFRGLAESKVELLRRFSINAVTIFRMNMRLEEVMDKYVHLRVEIMDGSGHGVNLTSRPTAGPIYLSSFPFRLKFTLRWRMQCTTKSWSSFNVEYG
jgi:hypothetical protein